MTRPASTGDARRATPRAGVASRPPARRRPRHSPHVQCAEPLEFRRLLSTFTVTTEADAGPGSLRQAILDANALPGRDEVRFNLAGAGVRTIRPTSPLPDLTDVVTIDGRSQPGYTGSPLIEVDGSAAGPSTDGIVVRRWSTVLAGLVVNRFSRHGVVVRHTDQRPAAVIGDRDTTILFCRIGTTPAGDAAAGNGGAGILVESPGVVIGGPAALGQKPANVISGNGLAGIWVTAPRPLAGMITSGVVAIGANYIGTDATGTQAVSNSGEGVLVTSGAPVWVGYTPGPSPVSDRNVISGNGASGVRIRVPLGSGTTHAIVNNYIGLSAFGNAPLGNGRSPDRAHRDGITVEGDTSVNIRGNVVSANAANGIRLSAITGGATLARNLIGTNPDGSAAFGNDGNGLLIEDCRDVTVGEPPVVDPMPGDPPPFSNVISGNRGHGVLVRGAVDRVLAVVPTATPSDLVIQNNAIGTSASGSAPLGNGGSGIYFSGMNGAVIGGDAAHTGNSIAANGGDGITLAAQLATPSDGNRIERNAIGGSEVSGNHRYGINVVAGSNNQILRNSVVGNARAGVIIQNGRGNATSQNRIDANLGLAIDLAPAGVEGPTPNDIGDLDAGPNDLQNEPILTAATFWPGVGSTVAYSLHSRPGRDYRLEFFSGGIYVSSVTVRTDVEGNASGVTRLAVDQPARVGATATEVATNNTSELQFGVTPLTTPIVGAYFFYNHSAYDGRDPAANAADDRAIAPDKYPSVTGAFLAESPAASSYTTYDKGINGVMFDIVGGAAGAPVTAADFSFMLEREFYVGGRLVRRTEPAPAPSSVTVRPGEGAAGSDRVTITWPDGAIRNGWLRVRYVRTEQTAKILWSFGNLVGNSAEWDSPGNILPLRFHARVNAIDLAAMRRQLTQPTADLTNRYDHNRDGRVDLLDLAVVRSNLGAVLRIRWKQGG